MSAFTTARVITRADLDKSVMPHIAGYDWAVRALDELWRMSTPTPESVRAAILGQPYQEKRILLSSVFAQWWADVQKRRGIETPLDAVIPARWP